MTNVLEPQAPSSPEQFRILPPEIPRDTAIKALLATDYDYAKDNGLIDMFYVNPDTGQDGLMHVFLGNVTETAEGAKIIEGFHHEPAPRLVSRQPITEIGSYVDRTHLIDANHDKRVIYKEHPYLPYTGKVFVRGARKLKAFDTLAKASIDNTPIKLDDIDVKNGMFPKEYDPLTVMKLIKQAVSERDKTEDKVSPRNPDVITNTSHTPLIVGNVKYPIRLVLDKATEKVITAFPDHLKPSALQRLKLSDAVIRASLNDHIITTGNQSVRE